MQLMLVRHAQNDWVGERLAGWTPGVHLNEEGRQQAETLGRRLAHLPLTAIYSSPLERAVETAQAIAIHHGLEIEILEDLGEVRYGEWTGKSLKELAKTELWPVVQVHPSGARFPQGENLRQVQARAVAALDVLRQTHPGETDVVAVVSHADVIKAVLAHYAGLHLDLFQRLVISPASFSVVRFTRFGPRIVCLNDTGDVPQPHLPQEEPRSQSEG
ncbi:MAG: MSMEG_4193 family putative phosphomutase [Chloroflexota bacterium]